MKVLKHLWGHLGESLTVISANSGAETPPPANEVAHNRTDVEKEKIRDANGITLKPPLLFLDAFRLIQFT